jgi:hypothetical protein
MDAIKLLKTNTTKFMLPMIIKDNITFNQIFEKGYVDSYIGDINRPEYDDKILILRDEPYIDDSHYSEEVYTSPCISIYSTEDLEHIYVHEIPSERLDDYGKFLQGLISEFSEEYKQHLIKFWNCKEDSLLYSILYDDEKKITNLTNKLLKQQWGQISVMGINKTLDFNKKNFKIDININDEILGLRVDF